MQYKHYHLLLNEAEINHLNSVLGEALSELKGLPKECYTNIFNVNISRVKFYLDIFNEKALCYNNKDELNPNNPDQIIKGYSVELEY